MNLEWELIQDNEDPTKYRVCTKSALSAKELNKIREILTTELGATFVNS